MKNKKILIVLLTVCLLAVASVSCSSEPKRENPSSSPLGRVFNLSGQVFTAEPTLNETMFIPIPDLEYKQFSGNLDVSAAGIGGNGKIENGILNISVPEPKAGDLTPFSDTLLDLITGLASSGLGSIMIYDDFTVFPSEASGVLLNLQITGSETYSSLAKTDWTPPLIEIINKGTVTLAAETVSYFYVDRDITVTASKKTTDLTFLLLLLSISMDTPIPINALTLDASRINMSLKSGWNAVYIKTTTVLSLLGGVTVTVDVSAANPVAPKWTLDPLSIFDRF